MNYLIKLTLSFVFFFGSTITIAQTASDDLQLAISKLEEGTRYLEEGDPRSSSTLAQASAMLKKTIEQHDLNSPQVYHALGNSYMLNDDLGYAVLAYRRGERLDPTNLQLQESLSYARSLVPISVETNGLNRTWSIMLVWRGYIDRSTLWFAFLAMSSLGWLALTSRVLGVGSNKRRLLGLWFVGASILPLSMLGSESYRAGRSNEVVVTSAEPNARSGPDYELYELVYTDGLQAGLEGRVLETRDSWSRLQLEDGSQCWLPTHSIEFVNPSSSRR